MKEIALTKGYVAIVDDEDYGWLSQDKWYAVEMVGGAKACRARPSNAHGIKAKIYMSREIMHAPPGMEVDHRNHKTLDNQKANLRVCTPAQNNVNRRKIAKGSSQYKGVNWNEQLHKWRARITNGGVCKHLGYFEDEIEAARAYNAEALAQFGEFGMLNATGAPNG